MTLEQRIISHAGESLVFARLKAVVVLLKIETPVGTFTSATQ